MASIPSSSTDAPLPDLEKPPTSDWNGSANSENVHYKEPVRRSASDDLLERSRSKWMPWKKFREDQKTRWWFASTGIPLLAASLGPLANVLSIAALVSYWRSTVYINDQFVRDFDGVPFADPRWCYWLNVGSLICGFLGNLFLLLNFTQRIRYLIALPATIIFWYLATGFLIAITACMQIYAPPSRPYQTYTQGFWYAVAAAAFYLICSMILMVNMLGYFLGHYPDHFALSDAQRTLILQTMLFFIWLAGGAAVFSKIEGDSGETGWDFADALYFCDVTILTVGFGDLYPTTDVARGIVFPYSVGGIIMLGLVISSIYKFMRQLGEENIIQKHVERMRERCNERTVTNSFDLRQREHDVHHLVRKRGIKGKPISAPIDGRPYRTAMGEPVRRTAPTKTFSIRRPLRLNRKPRLYLLREEKDRFEAMRRIQRATSKFKRWYALTISVTAFSILWCVGAVVFWQCEKKAQGMTYFQALYFCYISLLTIGYGDLSPKTNAGRTFFVVWSLIAVPTMTILVSDMGDTVVDKFKTWSDELADFTVLPKEGIWRAFLDKHPWLLNWIEKKQEERAIKKRINRGFETADPEDGIPAEGNDEVEDPTDLDLTASLSPNLEVLAKIAERDAAGVIPSPHALSRGLAISIRRVAADLRLPTHKKYSYEEWAEFTRLIRLSSKTADRDGEGIENLEDEEGLVEWDWIGEDSPLVSGLPESEWLLNKLCDALVRVEKRTDMNCRLEEIRSRQEYNQGKVEKGVEESQDDSTVRPQDAQNQVLASGANEPAAS